MHRKDIETIVYVSETLELTCNQVLFLMGHINDVITVSIPSEELLELVQKGYYRNNRITTTGIEDIEITSKNMSAAKNDKARMNTSYPLLTRETVEIVKALAKHFHRGELTAKEIQHLNSYTDNLMSIPFMFMFLQMFPTADAKKNAAWETHFGANGSGVTLRKMSRGTARKFATIWRKKDMGLFLLGTYLFVKQSYSSESDKYYVKNIENYLAEWEHWYQQAQEQMEAGLLDRFIKKAKPSGNRNTIVV